jgi:hypothetical protein
LRTLTRVITTYAVVKKSTYVTTLLFMESILVTPGIASTTEWILVTSVIESQTGDTCDGVARLTRGVEDSGDTCDRVTKEEIWVTCVIETHKGDSGDTCDGVTKGGGFW